MEGARALVPPMQLREDSERGRLHPENELCEHRTGQNSFTVHIQQLPDKCVFDTGSKYKDFAQLTTKLNRNYNEEAEEFLLQDFKVRYLVPVKILLAVTNCRARVPRYKCSSLGYIC